jgi:RNA polymerase sigma factor (TIGR02999 family)
VSDVTLLLQRIEQGEPGAEAALFTSVYDELRRLAAAKMAREPAGQTLQPTALVHEAWLRLGGDHQPRWQNRAHFFGAAAEAMRRILIDRARERHALRHGGGLVRVDLADIDVAEERDDRLLLAVDEALERFATAAPEKAALVKLRYFGGLSVEQAAASLGISEATAKRWWLFARAWIVRELQKNK